MAFRLLLTYLFFALTGASPLTPSDGPGKISIKAVWNPNYRPNGLAAYAKALSKWGGDVPAGLAKYASNKGQSTSSVRPQNFTANTKSEVGSLGAIPFRDDREYISEFGVGTPPQFLPLDLDTGSSDV